jgi:nucleotide-binding universal stress UspA family protein
MFQRILVPLDGSRLSEACLIPARTIAAGLGSAVTLLHVIERDAPQEVHHDAHLQEPGAAEAYLREIAAASFAPAIQVSIHVHEVPVDNVATSIVEHALHEPGAHLIIMSTHGRGGAQRLLFGSIAQQIAAESSLPVILVKPGAPPFRLERILVPLDPDSEHDMGLPTAATLAAAFGARLQLLSVVETFSTLAGEQAAAGSLMPGTTQAFLDFRAANAARDLETHQAELRARDIEADVSVERGDPSRMIVKHASASGADMIILATHGKAGAQAFWGRSVAPRVAEKSRLPVLLLPANSG